MRRYVWHLSQWPRWRYESLHVLGAVARARLRQGELRGRLAGVTPPQQRIAVVDALADDAVATSLIEGERFDPKAVRSSVANRLGVDTESPYRPNARVDGLVDMTLDAAERFDEPLTDRRLFRWHEQLFPQEMDRFRRPRNVGRWRDDAGGPMHIVSGGMGVEKVHYEAPPAARVPAEMDEFLRWFETPSDDDGLVRAAIAHLWFEAIHPFEDGNGRIGRAIADIALARDERSRSRHFTFSRQIEIERARYYEEIERAQRGDLSIDAWIVWFLGCYARAVDAALVKLDKSTDATRFWIAHAAAALSERQRSMLGKLLFGFEGTLTAKKWAKITKVSHDTANRDILDLVDKGILVRTPGGGRNTSYDLAPR